jgi:hypothetical protein
MALNANKSGGNKDFPKQDNIEPGVYPARLVQLIDLGLQPQRAFQGKDKPPCQEIMLTYELVDTFMKDEEGNDLEDKPRWISETLPFYGLFAENAKSTKRYLAFDPTQEWGGDFVKALGQPINVAVVNNVSGERTYDNVATISAMRPRDVDKCPDLVNEAKAFDLDAPDMDIFNKLPKWIQDKITGNLNFAGSVLAGKIGGKPAPAKAEKAKPAPKKAEEPEDDDAPF